VQLDGTLDKFPLRELIEMIVYSSVTGVLETRAGHDVGQIFFRDGRPYHAVAGERRGVDALGAMFEERSAPFRFVADRDTTDSTLWADPWDLIERGEEQASRWASVRAHIPNVECVPALRHGPSAGQIQISEMVWPVLAAVDGQRSVRQISEYLNWVLLDTCMALIPLIERELIAIDHPRVAIADPTLSSPVATEGQRPTNGFLERLLAEAQAKEQQRPDLTDDEAQDRKRVYRYRYVDDRR
jgi:hypothetical protein